MQQKNVCTSRAAGRHCVGLSHFLLTFLATKTRIVSQRPLPDPKSYRRTKTKAAQDFAVERSYDHQIKQGGGLLPFRQAAEVARQHALLQVPKVVRRSEERRVGKECLL